MIKKFFSSELGKGTIVLLITMNLFFFLNFVFHFIMGRMLGPEGYGIFAVLMSIIYIYGAPTEAIQNLVSKHTSNLNLKKENGKIKSLMLKYLKKGLKVAFCLFIVGIFVAFALEKFIKINFWLILLTNLLLFSSFSIPITRGILQGRKKFGFLGTNMILESVSKLIIGICLVFFGFNVFGAMYGVIFGALTGFIFSIEFNKDILKSKQDKIQVRSPIKSSPYFISMLVILLAFSIDIILAKRFFPADIVGKYAVLSILGKMIFFGTSAINKSMLPLASEKQKKKEDSLKVFKKSAMILLALCLIAISIYFLIPKFIISLFYGQQYIEISGILVYSAISFSFLSFSNLILVYGLSTDRLKKTGFLFIFLLIEFLALWLFHDSITEYILAFMVSNIIMFIGTLFFVDGWKKRV